MDFINGMSLQTYVKSKTVDKTIPEDTCRKFFKQIASAFEYLHQNNISHRDIKLDNILIEANTRVIKIIDFGFAAFT